MKNIPEFYQRRQGRPIVRAIIELESGQTPLTSSYLALKEEYEQVKVILEKLLNEQIQQLNQLILEAKQNNLHLASLSDADVDEEDVEVE